MDLIRQFLFDKRSTTRRVYKTKLRMFSEFMEMEYPAFFSLSKPEAVNLLLTYKNYLLNNGSAPATVNNHLAAVKSLIIYANRVGKCNYVLAEVKGLKVEPYRDTSGITPQDFRGILSYVDRDTLVGKRDYALLRLLWENALRRNEVSQCLLKDYAKKERTLWIRGKGRYQTEAIKISDPLIKAIDIWLAARKAANRQSEYLFSSLTKGKDRFTGESMYDMVKYRAEVAGIEKILSPHRIRHSSITAVLDLTGDVRKTQQLSRHKNINTILKYDDNRRKYQEEVTLVLSDLLDEE